jgi:4a-hydroxytetrahydrobiopterin dehydratase
MAMRLNDVEVVGALAGLEGWRGDHTAIARNVALDEAGVPGFLADLETIAREMNHDPDIERAGGDLTITMSTHSEGGVTELDVEYARRANELIGTLKPT